MVRRESFGIQMTPPFPSVLHACARVNVLTIRLGHFDDERGLTGDGVVFGHVVRDAQLELVGRAQLQVAHVGVEGGRTLDLRGRGKVRGRNKLPQRHLHQPVRIVGARAVEQHEHVALCAGRGRRGKSHHALDLRNGHRGLVRAEQVHVEPDRRRVDEVGRGRLGFVRVTLAREGANHGRAAFRRPEHGRRANGEVFACGEGDRVHGHFAQWVRARHRHVLG